MYTYIYIYIYTYSVAPTAPRFEQEGVGRPRHSDAWDRRERPHPTPSDICFGYVIILFMCFQVVDCCIFVLLLLFTPHLQTFCQIRTVRKQSNVTERESAARFDRPRRKTRGLNSDKNLVYGMIPVYPLQGF